MKWMREIHSAIRMVTMRLSTLAYVLPLSTISVFVAVACGSSDNDDTVSNSNVSTLDGSLNSTEEAGADGSTSTTGDGSTANLDSGGPPTGDPSDPDGFSTDSGVCTNSPAGVTYTETATLTGGKAYKVSYQVGGQERLAQVCIPNGAGPHPILVVNHGGFEGLQNELTDRPYCNIALAKGYIAVEAQYRGETDNGFGTSSGSIEFCNGEATDIIELLKIARNRCDADPKRVSAIGFSHGGCNTLQIASRGVKLKALIDYFGPTHAATLYDYHNSNRNTGSDAEKTAHNQLADSIPIWAGGTPNSNPQAYVDRSPALRAQYFATIPSLIIHGTVDYVVPHSQSCLLHDNLVSAGATFTNIHINTLFQPITDQVPGCANATYVSSIPSDWAGNHYFVIFDGQGHAFDTAHVAATLDPINKFLDAHM